MKAKLPASEIVKQFHFMHGFRKTSIAKRFSFEKVDFVMF